VSARHRTPPARRRPTVDLGTLPRRALAQAGPLLLVAVLVALVTAPASAVPRAVARVADDAVRAAVARAGTDADAVVTVGGYPAGRSYDPEAAQGEIAAAGSIEEGLRTLLGDVVRPPVAVTASVPFAVAPVGPASGSPGELSLRLAWTHGDVPVEWVAGTEPAGWAGAEPVDPDAPDPDAPDPDVAAPEPAEDPEPVQVGLSEAVARALGASAGDPLQAAADDGTVIDLAVTGVFRAVDPDAAGWHDATDLLEPKVATIGPSTSTQVAALLSDASLPAALLVVDPRQVQRTVRTGFDPEAVGTAAADRVLAELPRAQAAPATVGWGASGGALHSSAPGVLREALADLAAARAAATALMVGLVAVGTLLLVLTAGLLARRRAAELATRRTRGASLPALVVELTLEAVVVAGLGAAAGWWVAGLAVPGPAPAPLAVAIAGAAVLALVTAGLGPVRREADPVRARPRGAVVDVRSRRLAAEVALLALAVAAAVTLRPDDPAAPSGRGRGVVVPPATPDLLAAAAPALLAAVGAVLVARLLPAVLHRLALAASRSRRAVPVLAVARARSDGVAPLPLLAVATAAALVVVSASSAVAVRADQDTAAWAAVGGDLRVHGDADARLADSAARWAGAPGVDVAVAARVAEDVPARTADGATRVDVVAGDPEALEALAAALPAPAAEVPAAGAAVGGGPVGEVTLRWDGEERTVHPVAGLALPGAAAGRAEGRPVVVVDAAELGGAAAVPPTTAWLVGTGAADAVRADPYAGDAEVLERTTVLAELRADVLPRALAGAAAAAVALLLTFVALAVLVTAAAGGPARRRALDTLRTVGLTDREARLVAAGEVLPGALLATAAGALSGCAVAPVVLGPLGLAGGGGAGAVAWPAAALPVAAGLVAGVLVLQVEHARRRTHRLGQVLRTSA
jgi:putative ABC transport system permease protein